MDKQILKELENINKNFGKFRRLIRTLLVCKELYSIEAISKEEYQTILERVKTWI